MGDLNQVRQTLRQVNHFLSVQGGQCGFVEDVDLVLAEVMTNIVRHAYKDATGVIECKLVLTDSSIDCRLSDTGRAFDPTDSGFASPEPATFAEGGYGWFLIRSLTTKLSYTREGNQNILQFSVPRHAIRN
jgi:serine/threonine-protein kinase RsbW